jgi:hypothetical protein
MILKIRTSNVPISWIFYDDVTSLTFEKMDKENSTKVFPCIKDNIQEMSVYDECYLLNNDGKTIERIN